MLSTRNWLVELAAVVTLPLPVALFALDVVASVAEVPLARASLRVSVFAGLSVSLLPVVVVVVFCSVVVVVGAVVVAGVVAVFWSASPDLLVVAFGFALPVELVVPV